MKRKIVLGVLLVTTIFNLTACDSSKETNVSDEDTKQTVDSLVEDETVKVTEEVTEEENEVVEEEFYIVTSDDICAKVEDLAIDIFKAVNERSIATTNIENVSRHVSGFSNYFISSYDEQELKGCTQLGSFLHDNRERKADTFTVTATIKKTNFDSDGFAYYEGSTTELNATVTLTFHAWAEHNSVIDSTYSKDMSVILVLDDGVWKIKHFNQTDLGCDFTHIDDEIKKSTEEILGTNAIAWKKAYVDYFNQEDNCDFMTYSIKDINGDEIPEIFTDNQTLFGTSMVYIDKQDRINIIDCIDGYTEDGRYIITSAGNDTVIENIYQYSSDTGLYSEVYEGTYSSSDENYSIDGSLYNSIEEYHSAFQSYYDSKDLERVSCTTGVDFIMQEISDYK